MWWRSASFILDKQFQDEEKEQEVDLESRRLTRLSLSNSTMAETETLQNPNPKISAYYQTRAAHHGVVTSDWLAQAQAAVGRDPVETTPLGASKSATDSSKSFSVIDEFNNWRKQPDLAEAVAAIRALASVIRSSEATTMMELEIELKKASDSLKVSVSFISFILYFFPSISC